MANTLWGVDITDVTSVTLNRSTPENVSVESGTFTVDASSGAVQFMVAASSPQEWVAVPLSSIESLHFTP